MFYFVVLFSLIGLSFQTSSLAVGLDAMRRDPSSVDNDVSGDRDWIVVDSLPDCFLDSY